jgi:molybdopterin/thiamine biosynthesis adenylyltransferase
MRLKASLPSHKQIEVSIPANRTIGHLTSLIAEKLGIESDLTRLLIRDKPLSKNSRVSKLRGIDETITVDYLWARHLILWGVEGQRKIRSSTILLAGAGAIGNEVAKNLAMLGVGRLIVADRDKVELSNVSRMIFFEPKDQGRNKAEALAENLHRKYPYVETLAYRGELETLPLKYYLDSELIVCGLDNVVSRMFLTQTCRKYSVPLLDGGIIGLTARVHVYLPPDDPCPICIFPGNQYSQIAGLRNPCDAPVEQQTIPSFSTSISMVSSILAQETIKLILGRTEFTQTHKWPDSTGPPLISILFIDLKNDRFTPMEMKRNPKCFICGKDGTAKTIARRIALPLSRLNRSKYDSTIRETAKLPDGPMRLFKENTDGEQRLVQKQALSLKSGDYLRVFVETKEGEQEEAICRLT